MSVFGLAGLGVVLLVLGLIFTLEVLVTIGWIVLVIGLVLLVVDFFLSRNGGRGVFNRRRL